MTFFRVKSQFLRHVIWPLFYYLGITCVILLLIFGYFVLKNSMTAQLPRTMKAVEFGDKSTITADKKLPEIIRFNRTDSVPRQRAPPGPGPLGGNNLPRQPGMPAPGGPPMEPAPGIPGFVPPAIPGFVDTLNAMIGGEPPGSQLPIAGAPGGPPILPHNNGVPPPASDLLPPGSNVSNGVDNKPADANKNPPENSKVVEKKPRKGRPDRGEPGSDSYYVIAEQMNTVVSVNKTAYKSRTCSAITGRRILMNYGQNCCRHSQPLNCESGLKNGFDICIQFSQASIEPWFVEHNKKVFEAGVMAGYGVWKAYLIMRVLITLDDDDVLFYSDSGAVWLSSPEDYFCLMDQRNQDAVVFSVGLPENEYTKGDAFLVAGCMTENCTMSQQRMGGYSMYRKSMYAFNFLSTWLTYNQDLRIVSDEPSSLKKNLKNFKANRHDQTALSLSSKRSGLPEWPDPSQWGAEGYNKMLREKPEFKTIARTIIDCTRDKS